VGNDEGKRERERPQRLRGVTQEREKERERERETLQAPVKYSLISLKKQKKVLQFQSVHPSDEGRRSVFVDLI
jgi:hypothetical protein